MLYVHDVKLNLSGPAELFFLSYFVEFYGPLNLLDLDFK